MGKLHARWMMAASVIISFEGVDVTPQPCYGPRLSRRQMLQVGGAGLLGLTLPDLLRARSQTAKVGQHATADHLIVIFLNGGPSHLDMWDMKPSAPAEIRGEFQPIATTVPGVQFSEHLPRLAQHMHRCSIVRSAHHSVNNAHAAAVYVGLTGHDRGEIGGGARPTDHPSLGSVAGLVRPVPSGVLPYVSLPYITKEGAGGPPQPGFTGGWLGRNCDPLFVLRDPNSPAFDMPESSMHRRPACNPGPFYTMQSEKGIQCWTGVLLQIGEQHFIVTAAHTLDRLIAADLDLGITNGKWHCRRQTHSAARNILWHFVRASLASWFPKDNERLAMGLRRGRVSHSHLLFSALTVPALRYKVDELQHGRFADTIEVDQATESRQF